MSDDASARSFGNLEDRAARIATRVAKLARQARLALAWEALWPVLASAFAIAGLFVAASWFGVWGWLPLWARPVGVGITVRRQLHPAGIAHSTKHRPIFDRQAQ
jgi:hypothetical protein